MLIKTANIKVKKPYEFEPNGVDDQNNDSSKNCYNIKFVGTKITACDTSTSTDAKLNCW